MGVQKLAEIFHLGDYQTNDTEPTPGTGELSGMEWPPPGEAARIAAYADNRSLWLGDHESVLVSPNTHVYGEYIAVNIPRTIVTIAADLLAGEDLALEFEDDASEDDQERVKAIWERNNMQTLIYENALDTGYAGDGVWSVGRRVDGETETGDAVIKTHPAEVWFPETNPDDVRDIYKHRLAWTKSLGTVGKEKEYLRVVVHERGRVLHEMYELNGGKVGKPADDAVWEAFYPNGRPDEVQDGVDGEMLVVHVPNFRTARSLFGDSDYTGQKPLFAAIDMHMTQASGILDRHSDPVLGLPWDVWNTLTKGGKQRVDKAELDVLALGENGEKPEYITWDGKLDDVFTLIDKAMQQLALTSDTAPQLMALGDYGGNISGRALKIMLLRTLAKVNRKRRYFEAGIKKLMELAQRIEGVTEPVAVNVIWPDGLPADVLEAIEVMDRRLANETIGRKRAVQRLDDTTPDHAQAILDEIDEDEHTTEAAVSRNASQRQLPTIKVNAGLGEPE